MAPHRNDKGDELLWTVLGGIVLLVLLGLVIWINWHAYLSAAAITMAYHSIPVIDFIHRSLNFVGAPQPIVSFFVPPEVVAQLAPLRETLPYEDPAHVSRSVFFFLLDIPGIAARLLHIPLIIFGVLFIIKRSKPARLQNHYDIFALAKLSSKSFPHIGPVINEELKDKDPDSGAYRREASPVRFGIINQLLKSKDVASSDGKEKLITFDESKATDPAYIAVNDSYRHGFERQHGKCLIDQQRLELVLKKQLGALWTTSDDLPELTRALYAALICFAAGDKDRSLQLLDQFNTTWQPATKKRRYFSFDTSGVDAAIQKYESHDNVQYRLARHAYVNTMLPGMLREARFKGKMWTALFPWLKAVDRTLFYAMNQEGGQCGWTEASGARAHLLAELKLDKPIYTPYIQTAVDAYYEFLDDEGWLYREDSITTEKVMF